MLFVKEGTIEGGVIKVVLPGGYLFSDRSLDPAAAVATITIAFVKIAAALAYTIL